MTEETSFELDTVDPVPQMTTWQQNHGNLLLVFVALVLVIGAAILMYRQSRFVPVRFPNSDSISIPLTVTEDGSLSASPGIKISVAGAANDLGAMRLALYESADAFNRLDQAFLRSSATIKDGIAEFNVPFELVPEMFAIAAFHDENEDGLLNRNRFGVPSERYGFSEDARGIAGPPTYEQSLTHRPEVGGSISISIR